MKTILYLLSSILFLSGCTSPNPQVSQSPAIQKEKPLSDIWEAQLSDIEEQWKTERQKIVVDKHWDEGEPARVNYIINKVSKNGKTYLLQYSFNDNEDGGNSYGWVRDLEGNVIGKITDSYIERIPL